MIRTRAARSNPSSSDQRAPKPTSLQDRLVPASESQSRAPHGNPSVPVGRLRFAHRCTTTTSLSLCLMRRSADFFFQTTYVDETLSTKMPLSHYKITPNLFLNTLASYVMEPSSEGYLRHYGTQDGTTCLVDDVAFAGAV